MMQIQTIQQKINAETISLHWNFLSSVVGAHLTKSAPRRLTEVQICRAEARYVKWLELFGSNMEQVKAMLPPADVLLLWHAHMTLSPLNYVNDIVRLYGERALEVEFPLHLLTNGIEHIDTHSAQLWTELTSLPYDYASIPDSETFHVRLLNSKDTTAIAADEYIKFRLKKGKLSVSGNEIDSKSWSIQILWNDIKMFSQGDRMLSQTCMNLTTGALIPADSYQQSDIRNLFAEVFSHSSFNMDPPSKYSQIREVLQTAVKSVPAERSESITDLMGVTWDQWINMFIEGYKRIAPYETLSVDLIKNFKLWEIACHRIVRKITFGESPTRMMLLRLDKYISLVATNAREYPNETLIPVFDILLCIWTGQLNMRWFLQTFHPSVKYVVASYLNYKDIETLNMRFNYTDSLWRYNYRESYQPPYLRKASFTGLHDTRKNTIIGLGYMCNVM